MKFRLRRSLTCGSSGGLEERGQRAPRTARETVAGGRARGSHGRRSTWH